MSAWPLVSIVTPSLNQSRFIRETIESVLEQEYPNLEYWVIDGGSKDGTVEILESYQERINWISEPDDGQSQAVNKGWNLSHGEIWGWVNADDLLKPLSIKHAVNALLKNPSIGAVYGDTAYIDQDGKFIQYYPARPFDYDTLVKDTENYIPQPSVFVRRGIVEKAGLLNESLQYLMDYDLWLRMGLIAPMEYIAVEMAALRLHPGAKTIQAMPKFANEFAAIFQDVLADASMPPSIREQRSPILHTVHIHSASFCFWGGESRLALQHLRKAWEMQHLPKNRTFWYLLAFSILGRAGLKAAEFLHGNPMQLKKGVFIR
jgi:glycosyltransferase involved in cell wall biosynthesis